MKAMMSVLQILTRHKKTLAFSTIVCVVAMFVFKNTIISVVVASVVTSPYLILVLNNDDEIASVSISGCLVRKAFAYSVGCILVLFLSVIPSFMVYTFFGFGVIPRVFMVVSYSIVYCLMAPRLYKVATAVQGRRYRTNQYVVTTIIVGLTDLVIYVLNVLAAEYPVTSLISAPLVCLVYVVSLYLITIINLLNNNTLKDIVTA